MTYSRAVQDAYAVVRVRDDRAKHRLQLPIVIGASPLCDVFVNMADMPAAAFTVEARGGSLVVHDVETDREAPLSVLEALGVRVSGPIHGTAGTRGVTGHAKELLAREAAFVGRLPGPLRGLLLAPLPQAFRLTATVAVVAALGVAGWRWAQRPPEAAVDLSTAPIPLAFDAVRSETVGANPSSATFRKGYERGITFEVEAPAGIEGRPIMIGFAVAGLNIGKELELLVNDRPLFVSEAETACAQKVCEKTMRADPGLFVPGTNYVRFVHNEPQSSYFISNLLVRALRPLTPEDSEQLAHWLALGARAYDERKIVPENLLAAKKHVAAALKLARERTGGESFAARASVMRGEIDAALDAEKDRLLSDAAIADRLEKRDEVQRALEQLLRLIPDADSQEAIGIRQRLQALKEPNP
jgi:hypothetical protein